MDLSEFDGLEPVSKHELDTLLAHLPNGALGRFELRLILRVRELEKAIPCQDAIQLTHLVTSDPAPIEHSAPGEETTITINFRYADLDVQPMVAEEFTRAIEATMRKYGNDR